MLFKFVTFHSIRYSSGVAEVKLCIMLSLLRYFLSPQFYYFFGYLLSRE
jgi:hypothetical protein